MRRRLERAILGPQLQIGYLYEAGIGVPRDPVRAFHWYQLAAAGGLVSAKANLGIAYLFGDGVEKNQQAAFTLFHEAAQKGSGLAACFLGKSITSESAWCRMMPRPNVGFRRVRNCTIPRRST